MQTQKKLTAGRSMVEMLGVLAIIGVLSIGGIMGFRRAMDTHHVNNLMQDVSLLGMAVATRDQAVYNADCNDYEESNFTIPTEFATCKATYGADDLVVLTVTYNDQMPDRVIHMIENRCTQGIYVSAGATQFTVGSHGWNCELAAMERDQEPEDPSEWECQSANDCGYREECKSHKCRECPYPDYVGPEALSEECCVATAAAWDYPVRYTNGTCVWKEEEIPDEYKCAVHQMMSGYDDNDNWVYNCATCMSSNQVTDLNTSATYCCAEGESKSACCAAVGKFWCEKTGVCVDDAGDCDVKCSSHSIVTEDSECTCDWPLPVVDPTTNETTKSFCCDWMNDSYATCCDAAGGYWNGEDSWDYDGICFSEKPQPPQGNCVTVHGWNSNSASLGYWDGIHIDGNVYCCADDVSEEDCCLRASEYSAWCKHVCAVDEYYCDYLCDMHERAYDCMCPAATIYVSTTKTSDQPYCCAKGETLQACCQALGFTWIGPTANTGKCSAPDPDVCIKYITEVSDGLIH